MLCTWHIPIKSALDWGEPKVSMSENRPIEVPQTDPKAGYLAHQVEIDAAVHRVLERGWYILGREVESFEQEFAA